SYERARPDEAGLAARPSHGIEFLRELAPGNAFESLLPVSAFPAEGSLADFDGAQQTVSVADLERCRRSGFSDVPGLQRYIHCVSRLQCGLGALSRHDRNPPWSDHRMSILHRLF